jgi:xanthine dehydrogenase accessory factor
VADGSAAHAERPTRPLALIRGAGDLASGVAVRLDRAGFAVAMTEIAHPTPVRRAVAFAEAVPHGRAAVEGIEAWLAGDPDGARRLLARGVIAVIVDPQADSRHWLRPDLLVDALVAKRNLGTRITDAPAVVALGPGFVAGEDAHAVIETQRGHTLGRVITAGAALPNTGVPGDVGGRGAERVLRSPRAGVFEAAAAIGDAVRTGQAVGSVAGVPVASRLDGVLRGVLASGIEVPAGFKVGDVDPRGDREACFLVSDKALAVAGGVLEAACALLGGVRFAPRPERAADGVSAGR